MKNCKNCVHYDVCIETREYVQMSAYITRTDVEIVCKHFKDKNHNIEVKNDYVYFIVDKNSKTYAMVSKRHISDLTLKEIQLIDKEGRYFSTEDKAQKKLEEIKNEGT